MFLAVDRGYECKNSFVVDFYFETGAISSSNLSPLQQQQKGP
jgi:hypothetical protein